MPPAKTDLSVHWTHIPFCWFCREAARMLPFHICNKYLKLRLPWNHLHDFKVLMLSTYWVTYIWAPSSEFVSSSIPSWQILTAHAQPFRGARDLAFCLKVPLDSLFVWASNGGSGVTARMRRLAWTFAARIGDKYQIRLTRSILFWTDALMVFWTDALMADLSF